MPIKFLNVPASTNLRTSRPTGYKFPVGLNATTTSNNSVDYLVVAGGGGGGGGSDGGEGGGRDAREDDRVNRSRRRDEDVDRSGDRGQRREVREGDAHEADGRFGGGGGGQVQPRQTGRLD